MQDAAEFGPTAPHPPLQELAHRAQQAWTDFAATGDPGWAQYTGDRRSVMRIDTGWKVVDDPAAAVREAWTST